MKLSLLPYIILGIVLVLLASVGCTNTSSGSGEQTTAEKPEVHYVEIKGMKFIPDTVRIVSGDSVVFTNLDIVEHDVTEYLSKKVTSGLIAPRSSWGMTADGNFDFFCSLHPIMRGVILTDSLQ